MTDYDFNSFVKFEGVKKHEEDSITVTGTRAFGFPTKFYKEHGLANFKYVTLFFDKVKLAVAFRFHSDENEPHKYSLLKSKEGYGANAMAMSFFKLNGIEAKKYRGHYPYTIQNHPTLGDLYFIALKEHPVTNQPVKTEEVPLTTP